jgi:predicted O-linked N-acetylglucosamine transferase (SPINDLY family)
VALASDEPRRRNYRETLREMLLNSPLLDGVDFARRMEIAYRDAWRAWCG